MQAPRKRRRHLLRRRSRRRCTPRSGRPLSQSQAAPDLEDEGDHAAGGAGPGPSAPAPVVSLSVGRHHHRDGSRGHWRPLFTPANRSCCLPVCSCSRRFKTCSIDTRRLVAPLVALAQLDVQPAASRECSKLPIARPGQGMPSDAHSRSPVAARPTPASRWPTRRRAPPFKGARSCLLWAK